MKKYFEYITRIKNESKEVQKIILDNQHFLKTGKYKVNTAYKKMGYISSDDSLTFLKKNQYQLQREKGLFFKFKLLFRKTIESFYTINIKNDNEYDSTLLMVTNNNDLKLFNFEKNIIYNVFFDKIMYDKIKDAYNTFKFFFDIPLLNCIDEKQIIVEKYIEFIPYRQLSKIQLNNIIKKMFDNYYLYFLRLKKKDYEWIMVKDLVNELVKDVDKNNAEVIEKLKNKISLNNYKDKFPFMKCNGDMVFSNILFNNDKPYFIDWEHVNNYIFFYDHLNNIIMEAKNGNNKYLNKYLKGKYDKNFQKSFSLFNIKFNKKKRAYYLDLLIICKIIYLKSYASSEIIFDFLNWYIKYN